MLLFDFDEILNIKVYFQTIGKLSNFMLFTTYLLEKLLYQSFRDDFNLILNQTLLFLTYFCF